MYETAKNAAINAGYDIKQYTDIVDKGANYVAENLAWEAAAFWWKASGINEIVDKLALGVLDEVEKISAIINLYDS